MDARDVVHLQAAPWQLTVSRWLAQLTSTSTTGMPCGRPTEYTSDRDVVRPPMRVDTRSLSSPGQFLDVTDDGVTLAPLWERTLASVRSTLERE